MEAAGSGGSGAPSGDPGDSNQWRSKRKGTMQEQKQEQKKEQKLETANSDLYKDFRDRFKNEIDGMVVTESKVLMRTADPIAYLNSQQDLFYRMAAWFVMPEHEDFVFKTLQRNKDLLEKVRKIVLPFQERCKRVGYEYQPDREMLYKNLLLGVLQAFGSRGGTHDVRAYEKWRELKTWVILEDRKTGRYLLGRSPTAAAPAAAAPAAAAGASSSSSAGAGPSGSGQQPAVTDALQKALDEYDEQIDGIKKNIARLEADDADPMLPALVDAKLSLELVEAQKELLLAKRIEERAIDALKNTQSPSMQLFTDKSKAEHAVLDLELKIIELKQKLNV